MLVCISFEHLVFATLGLMSMFEESVHCKMLIHG